MGKRQRERKKASRLQQEFGEKRQRPSDDNVPLSAELRAELGEDSSPSFFSSRKVLHDPSSAKRKLSSSQKKRQSKAREKAAKFKAREELFQNLKRNAASLEELEVVKATVEAEGHSTTAKRARANFLQEKSGMRAARPTRLGEGSRVFARLWDGTVVRGRVSLAFGDGYCDIRTPSSSLKAVAPQDLWLDTGKDDDIPKQVGNKKTVPSSSSLAEPKPVVAPKPTAVQQKEESPAPPPEKTATTNGSTPSASAASLMMAQLAQLKTKSGASIVSPPAPRKAQEMPSTEKAVEKYVPHPLKMPVLNGGGPSPSEIQSARNTKVRLVERVPEIQTARMELPACGMEQEVVEAIKSNDFVVLSGETGSGKSTQIPQFLYEAGFGRIVVTQPRRVAAVTTARRVARELSAVEPREKGPSSLVGYRTRFDEGGMGSETGIVFETDGVLLQEMRRDILLRDYEAVVVDEAHERSLNTDVLLGLLSRAAPLRRELAKRAEGEGEDATTIGALRPLKVIIMSASKLDDVVENDRLWFDRRERIVKRPSTLSIPGRQHKVQIHFARETRLDDYVDAVLQQTCELHESEGLGGILVFLTGKHEVETVCAKLRTKYSGNLVRVFPLYASLPLSEQEAAFTPADELGGARRIVVATNVAETSVTVPDITFVVDSGRVKRRVKSTGGALAFEIGWISKASAQQRAGRAGRVGPGHVYRLYSTAVYDDQFPKIEAADIETLPLEDLVLNAKMLGVTDVATFPFITIPPAASLDAAHTSLARLGALARPRNENNDEGSFRKAKLTSFGRSLATLTIGVRCAVTTLAAAREVEEKTEGVTTAAGSLCVAITACSAERSLFSAQGVPAQFRHPLGDSHSRLVAIGAFLRRDEDDALAWCESNGLDLGTVERIEKLRRVLNKSVSRHGCFSKKKIGNLDRPATSAEDAWLARAIAAGHLDRLARKADPAAVEDYLRRRNATSASEKRRKPSRYERECAYELLIPVDGCPYAYIGQRSALHSRSRRELPDWLVYTELSASGRAADATRINEDEDDARLVIRAATAIDGASLAEIARHTGFVRLGDSLVDDPPPIYDASNDRILAFCQPSLSLPRRAGAGSSSSSSWELPLVRTPVESKSGIAFRVALARLLVDGTVPLSPSPASPSDTLAQFLSFDAKKRKSKRVSSLLDLLKEVRSVQHLRDLLASNRSNLKDNLRKLITQ